jgi:hypothetical protein
VLHLQFELFFLSLQQAWCQQVLVDLIHCLHSYFSSAETVLLTANDGGGQPPGGLTSNRLEAAEALFKSRFVCFVILLYTRRQHDSYQFQLTVYDLIVWLKNVAHNR